MIPNQKGQAALITVILVLVLIVVIVLGINTVAVRRQIVARRLVDSAQAYYLAEAGIEDALLRIIDPDLSHQSSSTITLAGKTATINIAESETTYTVTSTSDVSNYIRRLSTTLTRNTVEAEFFYGVQVGEGGLEIRHNDGKVIGNVYSNGTAFGAGEITADLTVAGDGNQIQDLDIGGNAAAYTCDDADIVGNLTYTPPGTEACEVGGSVTTAAEAPEAIPFPISDTTIADWKATAEAGGVITGNYTVDENESLGPIKINGNLHVDNFQTLTLTGVVWVTGNFTNDNGAVVQLASNYGELSGPIIFDGTVQINNNGNLQGSGHPDSFLLAITTNNSTDESLPAMNVRNNLTGAILYAPHGLVIVHNNANLQEITSDKLLLHKATVTYNSGLENANFSTGPSGGWTFNTWQEID